jgi:short-subunit dehydrogenase
MPRWNRAVVTGASSGIGASIARQLAADGTALVVVARDTDRLDALAAEVGVDVEVLTADLRDRDDIARIADRIRADEKPVDLVVNNAGLGFIGRFPDLDFEGERSVLDVNVIALHALSYVAAGSLSRRGGGGILNIASVAGYFPSAGSATYAASKAFVNSFSESLHREMKPAGVTVTTSCPGFTRTEFHSRADYDSSTVSKALWQSADTVATSALKALAKGRARVVPGWKNKIAVGLLKVLPLRIVRLVASKSTEIDG